MKMRSERIVGVIVILMLVSCGGESSENAASKVEQLDSSLESERDNPPLPNQQENLVDLTPTPAEPVAPMDSDNDGLSDENDACPNSVSREVDETGCLPGLTESREFTIAVEFASGKSEVNAQSVVSALHEVIELAQTYPKSLVMIEGFTDSSGSAELNQRLSQARSNAVASVIASLGIGSDRTIAIGRGESNPIATNETPIGRAANRRIVVTVGPAYEED